MALRNDFLSTKCRLQIDNGHPQADNEERAAKVELRAPPLVALTAEEA